jgi:integrase
MHLICEMQTTKSDVVGDRMIMGITPRAADKIYERAIDGPKGLRLRQGEKLVGLCRKAWRVVHRLYPREFPRDVPNPWPGVTLRRRAKQKKPAVTRDQVYTFAWGCIEHGEPEVAAAAVICFEWLQRPENVIAGHITWNDYRGPEAPAAIRIFHHKTNEIVLHPLEERTPEGVRRFYAEAEEVLSHLPRRGVPLILRGLRGAASKPYSFPGMQKMVQKMRKELELPTHFTLDACRHGGMTELEEAGLTDGQGRALSAHKSQQAYQGYAKRTVERALAATRKRHAHVLTHVGSAGLSAGATPGRKDIVPT